MRAKVSIYAGPRPVIQHKRSTFEAPNEQEVQRFVNNSIALLLTEAPDVIAVMIERQGHSR